MTCFIRMIDFLVMELLRRLVLTALRTFLAQVKAASMLGRYLHVNRFSRVKVVLKRTVDSLVVNDILKNLMRS